jgi:hypothetical protein
VHPLTPPGLPHRHFRPVILRTWGLNNVELDFRRSKYIQNMDNFGSSVPLYSLIFRFCLPPAPHIQDPPELSGGKLAHVECSFYHFSGVLKFICHKRESSGFFSKKIPPKPKKGSNLFFEVQIVGLTKAYLRIATGVLEMPKQP